MFLFNQYKKHANKHSKYEINLCTPHFLFAKNTTFNGEYLVVLVIIHLSLNNWSLNCYEKRSKRKTIPHIRTELIFYTNLTISIHVPYEK